MKQTGKRIGSLLLALCMILTLLPATVSPVWAAVTDANDWPIFTMSEYDNPETQEVILQQMLQNNGNVTAPWGTIVKEIIKQQKGDRLTLSTGPYIHYQDLTASSPLIMKNSLSAAYNEAAGKLISAINGFSGYYDDDLAPTKNFLNSKGNEIANIETEGPAFARYQMKTLSGSAFGNEFPSFYGAAGAITIQLFYDFKVEGLPDRFTTPDFAIGDDMAGLKSKGITYALGGSSDSYTVKAENYNDFPNTVQKSYTYEKSTATSTEVSNSYSKDWSEETTIGVDIKLPFVNLVSAKVEQKVGYSYGISKTYSTSKSDTYTQSISDTIEVPLPPHTGIDIDVNIIDTTTSIPYTGAVRITYKTIVVYAAGVVESDEGAGAVKNDGGSFSFGDETYTAVQDLDRRILNADISGYDPNGLNLRATSPGLMANTGFAAAANKLRSGQPYSPYGGVFNYTSKGTTITPKKVVPIYPAARFVPDTNEITLYEQQTQRLDGIKVSALNEFYVPYYGFNARLDGSWTVVDEVGDLSNEYAEIDTDRNGYPIVKANKPTAGEELYLRFQPNSAKVALDDNYFSEEIPLVVRPVQLSNVTLTGSFEEFILDDDSNTTDVSGLVLTAKDIDGEPFIPSDIKWYAEDIDGITIEEDSGAIEFDKAGFYQIYAVVNEVESNRIPLTVLPARQLDEITIDGSIPTLIWDDDSKNAFDLSGLTVSGEDQYGDPFAVSGNWALGSDLLNADEKIAKVESGELIGLKAGSDMLWMQVNIETDDNPVYVESNSIAFTVKDSPYPVSLSVMGEIPHLIYNDTGAKSFNLTILAITAMDQYGDPFTLDPDKYIWTLEKTGYAAVSGNILTGLVVGTDSLTLSYPTAATDGEGAPLGHIMAQPLEVTIKALPYVNELYYSSGAPMAREGVVYDLSRIPLLARDQYGDSIPIPGEIVWTLAANNQTGASIEGAQLTVAEGAVPYASVADVILQASSPSSGKTANNVVVKVRQQPVLTRLAVEMDENFVLRINENALLSDHFTVAGYDQYEEGIPAVVQWHSDNPEAILLEDGILYALKEDVESFVYATCINSKAVEITSNKIPLTVGAARRLNSIAVGDTPQSVNVNETLSLNTLTVATFDQYGQAFTDAELAAYPADIRWTLENNRTAAVINGDKVSFGSQKGKVTLICACVNSDTGTSIAEKRIDIYVGPYVSAISAASVSMPASGGSNAMTLAGVRLENGLRIAAFDAAGNAVAGMSAVTAGNATQQKATLSFPANTDTDNAKAYTVKVSYDDGAVYETVPVAAVTIAKAGGGGIGGGGGGSTVSGYTITASAEKGGSISPSGEVTVQAGKDKTFTITPDTDYDISDVLVDGKSVGAVKTYTFKEVSKAHIIRVKFAADGELGSGVFDDVKDSDWFAEAVQYVYENGLMMGTGETTFGPYETTTRGMIVAILYRLENSPEVDAENPFSDVAEGKYYADAAAWAAANQIVSGYGDGRFGAEDPITREQLAVILMNYARLKDYDVSARADLAAFTDVDSISGYARDAMTWANAAGLIQGSGGNLVPTGNAERAQVAAILQRFLENVAN